VDDGPILLVDRDAAFRHTVERTAEGFGLRVVVAADARRGLEIAEAAEPCCAVIELELLGRDGLWLANELRARPALSTTPIVLLTANDDVLLRLRALQGGIDLLLDKPIEPAVLIAQVRAILEMAGRLRDRGAISSMLRRAALDESPSSGGPGAPFTGEIATMPPATALTILEIDRRTGSLELRATGRPPLVVDVASGFVLGGQLGPRPLEPAEAIREALGMKRGRFEFRAQASRPAPPGLLATTRQLWLAIEEAAESTMQGQIPSGPATELADAPVHIATPAPPRSAGKPPTSSAKAPQRTTTLASSPAVDSTSRRRRQSEVVREVIRVERVDPPSSIEGAPDPLRGPTTREPKR
jgi:CheY-like chemotaxis protein